MKAMCILMLLLAALGGCAVPAKEAPAPAAYSKITGEQAVAMMEGNAIILDVRTQTEFDEGHIRGAILLPYDEIEGRAATLLPEKNATIFVYCRTGRRSEIAARALIAMGYTTVYDFGGIATDWMGEVIKE